MADDYYEECPNYHCDALIPYFQDECHTCGSYINRIREGLCLNCERQVDFTQSSCFFCKEELYVWDWIIDQVRVNFDPYDSMIVSRNNVPSPKPHSHRAIGKPKGQQADYRVQLEDGSGVHILEYDDHYAVHWDKHHPRRRPVRHLIEEAPTVALGLGGAAVIAAATRSE